MMKLLLFLILLPASLLAQKTTLTWDQPIGVAVVGNNIYRSENGIIVDINKIATVQNGVTSYVDTAVQYGHTYTYAVDAFTSTGIKSAYSEFMSITPVQTPNVYVKSCTDSAGRVWGLTADGTVYMNDSTNLGGGGTDFSLTNGICYLHGNDNPQTWWYYDFTQMKWITVGPTLPGGTIPPPTNLKIVSFSPPNGAVISWNKTTSVQIQAEGAVKLCLYIDSMTSCYAQATGNSLAKSWRPGRKGLHVLKGMAFNTANQYVSTSDITDWNVTAQ